MPSSSQKTPETPYQNKALESGDIKPYIHLDLELFHRRKQLLITYYSGLLNPASMRELASQFGCSEKALYVDWERRAKWEPFIWENYQAQRDGKVLLAQLQLARETALLLMKNPRISGNARVGAIGRFTDAIKAEVELSQSLGFLQRAKIEPAVNVEVNVKSEQHVLLKEYAGAIEEAAALNRDFSEVHTGKQVDPGQTASGDRPKRANQ